MNSDRTPEELSQTSSKILTPKSGASAGSDGGRVKSLPLPLDRTPFEKAYDRDLSLMTAHLGCPMLAQCLLRRRAIAELPRRFLRRRTIAELGTAAFE
jgi:hypothetical protein